MKKLSQRVAGFGLVAMMGVVWPLGGCNTTRATNGAEPAAAAKAGVVTEPRVIEVSFMPLAENSKPEVLATAAGAMRVLRQAQPGFVAGNAARTEQGGVLEVAVWGDVEQAEAASLATAGSKVAGDTKAAAGGGVQTLYFRELRTHRYAGATTGHLEVVVFRAKAGVTREEHLAAFDAAEADFAGSGGLAGHDLGIAPDGRWVHVVYWKSAAAFETVGKGLMKQPGIAGWFKTLDYRQFSMQRGDVVGAGSTASEKPAAGK